MDAADSQVTQCSTATLYPKPREGLAVQVLQTSFEGRLRLAYKTAQPRVAVLLKFMRSQKYSSHSAFSSSPGRCLLSAHVGSPDVFYEGKRRPVPPVRHRPRASSDSGRGRNPDSQRIRRMCARFASCPCGSQVRDRTCLPRLTSPRSPKTIHNFLPPVFG